MMRFAMMLGITACVGLLVSSCSRQDVVPERLESRVDRDLRYVDVKQSPEQYQGKLMLAGGKVLSAQRLQDGTRIEVLQIPLSDELMPVGPEAESKGRFVAMDVGNAHVADPAVFDQDKRITLVGEVVGTSKVTIGEVEQQVPKLAVKHMTVWDWDRVRGGYAPYYGYRYPYAWGYRGYYGYPYYW